MSKRTSLILILIAFTVGLAIVFFVNFSLLSYLMLNFIVDYTSSYEDPHMAGFLAISRWAIILTVTTGVAWLVMLLRLHQKKISYYIGVPLLVSVLFSIGSFFFYGYNSRAYNACLQLGEKGPYTITVHEFIREYGEPASQPGYAYEPGTKEWHYGPNPRDECVIITDQEGIILKTELRVIL